MKENIRFYKNQYYYFEGIDNDWKSISLYKEKKKNEYCFKDIWAVGDITKSDWCMSRSELFDYHDVIVKLGKDASKYPEYFI